MVYSDDSLWNKGENVHLIIFIFITVVFFDSELFITDYWLSYVCEDGPFHQIK